LRPELNRESNGNRQRHKDRQFTFHLKDPLW